MHVEDYIVQKLINYNNSKQRYGDNMWHNCILSVSFSTVYKHAFHFNLIQCGLIYIFNIRNLKISKPIISQLEGEIPK